MPVENATNISDLNPDWPVGASDFVSQGDDHLRMMKKVLQNDLPNIDGPIAGTPTQINNITLNTPWQDNTDTAGALSYFRLTDPTKTDGTQAALSTLTPTATQYNADTGLGLTWKALQDLIYPVNSVIISSNSANPNTYLGFGTWTARAGYVAGVGSATNSDSVAHSFLAGVGHGRAYAHRVNISTETVTPTATFAGTALPGHAHQSVQVNDGSNTPAYGNASFSGMGLTAAGWSNGYHYSAKTQSVSAGTPAGTVTVKATALGTQTEPFSPSYVGLYVWERTA